MDGIEMDKYKLFFYRLAVYTNALAEDCDKQSVYLHIHGITDPWACSRKVFDSLDVEIRNTLQRLREEDDNERRTERTHIGKAKRR